jgi:Na+-driven multidrug efflux pump
VLQKVKIFNTTFNSKRLMQKSLKAELFKTYKLALPIIISQLGVILMATSDNVIVGRLLGPP